MKPAVARETRRLKYAATVNDEALVEGVDPDFELQYVDIGNVDSEGRINGTTTHRFEAAPSRARRMARHGDVIVSTVRTYLQAIAPIENPPKNLIVSTGFAVVRPRPEVLDTEFCKYALREPAFLAEVEMRSVGVSYPAINATELGDVRIHMCSLAEQRSIGSFLNNELAGLDTLVSAKEELLGILAEKRQALIMHAVTRGLNPNASVRDSGVPWLGQVPAHWDTRKVAFLFKERDERGQPDLPLLIVSINSGVTVREFSDEHIEQVAADFGTYKVAVRNDIAFNKMRMWQGAVGVVPTDGLVSPDYVVARPIAAMVPTYFGQLFRIPAFSAESARNSHGIVWDRLRLYWDGFRDIKVPYPPIEEQDAIVAHIGKETAKVDGLRAAAENSIALLKERRSALISAAVTGRLRLPCNSEASANGSASGVVKGI